MDTQLPPKPKQKLKDQCQNSKGQERKSMKFLKRKIVKVIFAQIALLVALLVVQMGMQFASSYHWVGFEKKDGDNWYSVAMNAQAYNSNCQIDLVKANEQLEDFRKLRDSENADIQ